MQESLFYKLLQKQDEGAVTTLVKDYRDMVYRTCLAYVQHEHSAEDLTQDVFLKVLERIGDFKGNSKLSTWIIRIAINLSLNYIRNNKKYLNQLDATEMQLAASSDGLDSIQTKKAVRKAIYALPEKQRKVFVLSFYMKLSYKEMEDVTGFSKSSIESLLFRARKKLHDLLIHYYKENYT